MKINVANETVELLPEKALYWPTMEMLVVADVLLGKVRDFHSLGVAQTEVGVEKELERLSALVERTGAKRCLFVGDLIDTGTHIPPSTLKTLASWVKKLRCPIYLTLGSKVSQDLKKETLSEWGIAATGDPLIIPPFAFTHEPEEIEGCFTWAGHVHPQVVLKKGSERVSMPCFHVKEEVGILPAFGNFVEGQTISWTSSDKVYATTGAEVIQI
jgi:DNA ligase-associated metallophosphoesterase